MPPPSGPLAQSVRSKPRIVIAAPRIVASFTRQDARLLSDEFDVSLVSVRGLRGVVRLHRAIRSADAVLVWFIGRHALAAVLSARLGKVPTVGIVGGFEVAWIESVGYGIRPGSLRGRIIPLLLSHMNRILTVSTVTDHSTRERVGRHVDKVVLIPNAVDTGYFTYDSRQERRGVLSVGNFDSSTLGVKNWALYRDLATAMPGLSFRLVGEARDRAGQTFIESLPTNATWTGLLSQEQLRNEYQRASVYFHGSLHESFSLATAEAMACGCIPVVSSHGALPDIVGDAGLILPDLSPTTAAAYVRKALDSPDSMRTAARQRIVDHFDVSRRQEALVRIVRQVIAERHSIQ